MGGVDAVFIVDAPLIRSRLCIFWSYGWLASALTYRAGSYSGV